MLLAPVLGDAAARDRRAPRATSSAQRLGPALDRVRGRGAGLPEPVPRRRLVSPSAVAACSPPGARSARAARPRPERVIVEFVSANPTGPLPPAGGRHAAYGDALARILDLPRPRGRARVLRQRRRHPGAQAGRVDRAPGHAGRSVPEGGYEGDYVARARRADPGRRRGRPRRAGAARHRARSSRGSARRWSASASTFDTWFFERTLHEGERGGDVERAVARAASSAASPTRPRARSGCARPTSATTRTASFAAPPASTPTSPPTSPTTRTSARAGSIGSSTCSVADHHGYVTRMKAAFAALGGDPDRLEMLIMQFVHARRARRAGGDEQAPRASS